MDTPAVFQSASMLGCDKLVVQLQIEGVAISDRACFARRPWDLNWGQMRIAQRNAVMEELLLLL